MRPSTIRNAGTAAAISILMIGFAIAFSWVALAPGVFGPETSPSAERPQVSSVVADAAPLLEGIRLSGDLQFSQPRDPFRPLITEDGVVVTGNGTGGTNGGVTGTIVNLTDIYDTGDGTLRAKVTVDGTEYDVGVGETFGGSFKVVSIDADSVVFLYGDNAFELSEGQEIIK